MRYIINFAHIKLQTSKSLINIAIIGFGKLGLKISELIDEDSKLNLGLTINSNNLDDFKHENFQNIDVAIELSGPDYAYANLIKLAEFKVATVCGSTGWTSKLEEIKRTFAESDTSFLYASNFSLGMNIFFEINKRLASLMSDKDFDAKVHEVHHVHKLDSPSGTSLTIANGVIDNHEKYNTWKLSEDKKQDSELEIDAERKGEVKGDHTVLYKSKFEHLSFHHSAHDRAVFAEGALAASKFIFNRKGIFGMNDVIGI